MKFIIQLGREPEKNLFKILWEEKMVIFIIFIFFLILYFLCSIIIFNSMPNYQLGNSTKIFLSILFLVVSVYNSIHIINYIREVKISEDNIYLRRLTKYIIIPWDRIKKISVQILSSSRYIYIWISTFNSKQIIPYFLIWDFLTLDENQKKIDLLLKNFDHDNNKKKLEQFLKEMEKRVPEFRLI